MFQPVNNSPEELIKFEQMVYEIIDWSKDRMHQLVEESNVDDATAIYFEFSEWYDPEGNFEVAIVDDFIT